MLFELNVNDFLKKNDRSQGLSKESGSSFDPGKTVGYLLEIIGEGVKALENIFGSYDF